MKEPWQDIPDGMEDITPTPGYLRDLARSQDWTWVQLIGHLMLHAISTEARSIDVTLTKEGLTIADDGQGCATPATTFVVPRPAFGRRFGYRAAISYAALALGDHVEITTVHEGTKRTLSCDYAALANAGDWDLDVDAEPTMDRSGTSITIRRFAQPMPPIEGLTQELSDSFTSRNGSHKLTIHS